MRLGNAWGQSQIKAPFKTGPAGIAVSCCCHAEDELCLLLAFHSCVRFLIQLFFFFLSSRGHWDGPTTFLHKCGLHLDGQHKHAALCCQAAPHSSHFLCTIVCVPDLFLPV